MKKVANFYSSQSGISYRYRTLAMVLHSALGYFQKMMYQIFHSK